jgi:CheY-like chemotaxis protein
MQVQWAHGCDTQKSSPHATPPSGWRVLVVDDEIFNREYLSAWMARLGVQVQTASNGDAALQQLSQSPFDMVLMDMHMPGLTGPQTARLMRQLPQANPALLIVGLSGTLDDETRALYLQNGANILLQKPIDWDLLWRWVSEHNSAVTIPRTTGPTPYTATV